MLDTECRTVTPANAMLIMCALQALRHSEARLVTVQEAAAARERQVCHSFRPYPSTAYRHHACYLFLSPCPTGILLSQRIKWNLYASNQHSARMHCGTQVGSLAAQAQSLRETNDQLRAQVESLSSQLSAARVEHMEMAAEAQHHHGEARQVGPPGLSILHFVPVSALRLLNIIGECSL